MERRKRIALIMPEIIDPSDYELIHGVHAQAKQLGLDVVILTGVFNSQIELQQDGYIHALENVYTLIGSGDFDGILFASERFRNQPLIQRIGGYLQRSSVPCLALGDNGGSITTLHAKQAESICQLTRHLIDVHGCRSLWCITGTPDSRASALRTAGFRRAMEEAGLPVCEDRIFYGNFWKDVPAQIGQRIVSGELERPDAVVCASDVMAVALIEALEQGGMRVPEDIAVTGYDGGWTAFFRGVTTMTGWNQQHGAEAVCKLYEMMTGETVHCPEIRQKIRLGGSCGCKTGFVPDASIERYFEKTIQYTMHKQEFLASNLVESFSNAGTLEEWSLRVKEQAHVLSGWEGIDICLCEDWQFDYDHPERFRQLGFSDTMLLASSRRHGKNPPDMVRFPLSEIVPALSEPHEPLLLVVSSFCLPPQILGYVVGYYSSPDDIRLDEGFINWCDAAANGLNELQNMQYRRYQLERLEHLLIRDPVTGFLNRRGLAEILPDYLHEMQKKGAAVNVTAVQCSAPKISGYDTSLLLANSLRSVVSAEIYICRSDERVFLLVGGDSHPELIAQTEAQLAKLLGGDIRMPELLSVTKTLRTHSLSEQIMEIQELRQQIECCTAYAADYRQALPKLRLQMTNQPQLDWSMEKSAKEIGISQSHLQRLYRELFGTTMTEDLICARVSRAEFLLLHTQLRITEIAAECGYQNETHFMRQFKKRKGMTPTQFREHK